MHQACPPRAQFRGWPRSAGTLTPPRVPLMLDGMEFDRASLLAFY
jgi:hypothetical protein